MPLRSRHRRRFRIRSRRRPAIDAARVAVSAEPVRVARRAARTALLDSRGSSASSFDHTRAIALGATVIILASAGGVTHRALRMPQMRIQTSTLEGTWSEPVRPGGALDVRPSRRNVEDDDDEDDADGDDGDDAGGE